MTFGVSSPFWARTKDPLINSQRVLFGKSSFFSFLIKSKEISRDSPTFTPPLFGVCSRKAPFSQANTEQSSNKPRTSSNKILYFRRLNRHFTSSKAIGNYLKKSNPLDIQKSNPRSLFLKINTIIITIVILIPH